jgi:hypothetical protein
LIVNFFHISIPSEERVVREFSHSFNPSHAPMRREREGEREGERERERERERFLSFFFLDTALSKHNHEILNI